MFTPEQRHKISEALNAKALKPCPLCGRFRTFQVGDALVVLVLQENPNLISPVGKSYPSIPVLCTYCGYTMLFNALILDLAEILDLPASLIPKQVGYNG